LNYHLNRLFQLIIQLNRCISTRSLQITFHLIADFTIFSLLTQINVLISFSTVIFFICLSIPSLCTTYNYQLTDWNYHVDSWQLIYQINAQMYYVGIKKKCCWSPLIFFFFILDHCLCAAAKPSCQCLSCLSPWIVI
jgi:hypothetical protein